MALLRISLGLLFLIAGVGKFTGEGGAAAVSEGIAGMFAESWLPGLMVKPFAYVTPYAEVLLGALLIVGFARCAVVPLSGLFMLSLTLGMMVLGKHDVVLQNMIYTALFSALLALGSFDRFTLDHLIFGRKSKPVGFTPN